MSATDCSHTWSHEWQFIVLIYDGSGDVGVQDVDAESKNSKLDQSIVAFGLLARPPTHDSEGNVENRCQSLEEEKHTF